MLDCIIKEDKLIDYALELGLTGVAITDHESVSGYIKALKYMKSLKSKAKKILETEPNDEWANQVKNFKLVLGNEIYLCRDGLSAKNFIKGEDKFWHFILLAKDKVGNKQLRELSSRAWSRSFYQFMERVPTYYSDIEEIIGENPGHVVAQTACLGSFFDYLILNQQYEKALNFCHWCEQVFGKENFFIEIQPGLSKEQVTFNTLAAQFAKKNHFNITVTTDSHYLRQEDREIHKSFLNSGDGDRETDDFYAYTYMMSADEIREKLNYFDEDFITQIFENSNKVCSMIEEYDLAYKQIVPRIPLDWHLIHCEPQKTIGEREYLNKYLNSEYEEDRFFLYSIIQKGLELNCLDKIHLDRLEEELQEMWIVSEKIQERLSAYFITVRKVIDIAWTDGDSLVGPWRGSVGSMLSAYLMDIIQRDPLKSPTALPYWRFCSRGRAELADVDIDSQASKRERFIEAVRRYFESIGGELTSVATFGTETSKAALQTAARGLGYEPELGSFLSSLIPIDRGFVRSLQQCYYGDEEKGYQPIPQFIAEMGKHEDIWNVARNIEGLISRRGVHASGIILTNDKFTELGATMKSPKGVKCSQWELHDEEYAGHIKYDFLTIDGLDRIRTTMELLLNDGLIEWQGSLKATYMKYLNPDVIDYDNPEMWKLVGDNKIISLFQFDTPVGLQTAKQIKPKSLLTLAQSNSLMRLMPEKGQKTPVEEFVEYQEHPEKLKRDIYNLNATTEEKDKLYEFMKEFGGVLDSQESLMRAVMLPFTNYNVDEANKVRKTVAKKKFKEIASLKENLYQRGKELGTSKDIIDWIWSQAEKQMGYSFSIIHTIAYSTVAIQELNLAYFYDPIYWDTACLIVDSGGLEDNPEDEDYTLGNDIEDELEDEEDTKKKSSKTVQYGKISSAIGKMKNFGVDVELPDINASSYTFVPDVEHHKIIYGLKGITRVSADYANEIIDNRPYNSFEDFLKKVKSTKLQIINLIKCGAFDKISSIPRESLLRNYIESIAETKNKLTLANMPTLIRYGIIPNEYQDVAAVYNFNKFLKKNCKSGLYYLLDDYSLEFFNAHFNPDLVKFGENGAMIEQTRMEKIYKAYMDKIRPWLKESKVLESLNKAIIDEIWNKYCSGFIPKWEMDSVGYYDGAHELDGVDFEEREIDNFFSLPEEPIPETVFTSKEGKEIPIYKLHNIAGTVIEKNKLKNIVTLLTQYGVVKVKIYKPQFVKYDKQSFIKDEVTGKKTVTEKSWFTRGNKLIIQCIRRGDNAIPKAYKTSPYKPITLISDIDYSTGHLTLRTERTD